MPSTVHYKIIHFRPQHFLQEKHTSSSSSSSSSTLSHISRLILILKSNPHNHNLSRQQGCGNIHAFELYNHKLRGKNQTIFRTNMRAGGCTLQQTLTAEAATVIKQAVTLAKRRGHAQVTPLHVANTMLSSSQGLFRTACLQSHSHPLQCKALELCFNVALNRLPASSSTTSSVVPMMGSSHHHHHYHPSISNALVAAFKRAQAHQRRGSIENQQQPLLAVKIELDQLIISILDDPSVSRVMREAGFSSTQVKTNVEKTVSLERTPPPPPIPPAHSNSKSSGNKSLDSRMIGGVDNHNKPGNEDDVSKVIETLMKKKRRNPIIVGECIATMEGVIRQVMDKVEKDAPEAMKNVKFMSLSLQSLTGKSKEEVDFKIRELRSCLVTNRGRRVSKGGVLLYLGDLKWTTEFRVIGREPTRTSGLYCPVDHMIVELGKLISCDGGGHQDGEMMDGRFWVMGVASFQTYIKCRDGHPSLESIWSLLPLTIAADTLSLTLNSHSEARSSESGSICNNNQSSSSRTTLLPTWLRQYKDENKRPNINHQECVHVESLCKWDHPICYSVQEQCTSSSCGKTMPLISSVSPSSSNSGFSYEYQNSNFFPQNWPLIQQHESTTTTHSSMSTPFSSNPNSTTSSSDVVMEIEIMEYISKFKNVTAENFKLLRGALEKKVPWQMDTIPDIASTILRCRSGMMKRKGREVELSLNKNEFPKEETWLLFEGSDVEAKVKIGRELARLIFGSRSNFVALSSFSSTRADSTDEYLIRNKTSSATDESCSSYIDRFSKEVSCNPHRVFFIEDVEQADYWSQVGLKRAIERGKVINSRGQEVSLCDSIIILSCESISSRSRACSPPADDQAYNDDTTVVQMMSPFVSLDLDLNLSVEDYDASIDDDIGNLILESVDRRFVFKVQESS